MQTLTGCVPVNLKNVDTPPPPCDKLIVITGPSVASPLHHVCGRPWRGILSAHARCSDGEKPTWDRIEGRRRRDLPNRKSIPNNPHAHCGYINRSTTICACFYARCSPCAARNTTSHVFVSQMHHSSWPCWKAALMRDRSVSVALSTWRCLRARRGFCPRLAGRQAP